MPQPAHAPILLGNGHSSAFEHARLLAQEEALRRGVELIVSDGSASRLVEQSESAQLVVVGDQGHRNSLGATVAHAARMPVIVAP